MSWTLHSLDLCADTYVVVGVVLNTFLSNALLLIGGMVMCFITSWRLSILAITSIGPILQVTRAYAVWSQQINREIWAALGDASAIATQAISNIRTVRAFGCEDTETKAYNQATGNALQKGNTDAVASAGTYAITNYFDLGCTVLLLWYGGLLVMRNDGELTVGKLITVSGGPVFALPPSESDSLPMWFDVCTVPIVLGYD